MAGARVVTFPMPLHTKIVRRSLGTWYRMKDILVRFGWKSWTTVYRHMKRLGITPDDFDAVDRL